METRKFNPVPLKEKIKNDFKILEEPFGFLFIAFIITLIASFWKPAIYGLGIIIIPIIFWIAKGGIGTSIGAFFRLLFNLFRMIIKR